VTNRGFQYLMYTSSFVGGEGEEGEEEEGEEGPGEEGREEGGKMTWGSHSTRRLSRVRTSPTRTLLPGSATWRKEGGREGGREGGGWGGGREEWGGREEGKEGGRKGRREGERLTSPLIFTRPAATSLSDSRRDANEAKHLFTRIPPPSSLPPSSPSPPSSPRPSPPPSRPPCPRPNIRVAFSAGQRPGLVVCAMVTKEMRVKAGSR
jgi:hypothetical protein